MIHCTLSEMIFTPHSKENILKRQIPSAGYWTDDSHKKHHVIFQPVDPDTLSGLRPKVTKTYVRKKPEQRNDGLKIGSAVGGKDQHRLVG